MEEIQGTKVLGVVGYFSKRVQNSEKNYPLGELELLGMIDSLRHFRYLLHGRHFILRTDHISLLAMKNVREPSKRAARYLSKHAGYDFELQFLPGKDNIDADAIA